MLRSVLLTLFTVTPISTSPLASASAATPEVYEGEAEDREYDDQYTFIAIKAGKTHMLYGNYNGDEEWCKPEEAKTVFSSFLQSIAVMPRIEIEYLDQFGRWHHYQTKNNATDSYRIAKNCAKTTCKLLRLSDETSSLLDLTSHRLPRETTVITSID